MLPDFHNHTCFSGDSSQDIRELLDHAVELGMPSICITDHQDFDYVEDGVSFTIDPIKYYETLKNFQKEYAGRLDLRIGVETGLGKEFASRLADFTRSVPFDFIIGSIHVVSGIDPYYDIYWEGKSAKQAISQYFEASVEALETCHDFDIFGHIDYGVRYCKEPGFVYNPLDYIDYLDALLKKLLSLGKGIELNTGGLYKGANHPNPHPAIIKRYRELGGEIITLGSDDHQAKYLGYAFDQAQDLLKDCGFKYYCTFKDRKAEFHKF